MLILNPIHIVYSFIILLLFLPNIVIGGYNLPLYCVVLMAGFNLMYNQQYENKISRRVPNIYIAYIFLFLIISVINGDAFVHNNGIISLLIKYISCIFIYYFVDKYFNDSYSIEKVFKILLFFIGINIIVTLLQHTNSAVGWGIWKIFNPSSDFYIQNLKVIKKIDLTDPTNFIFTPGIFASPVLNGYYTASYGIIAFYFLFSDKIKRKFCYWGFLILIVYTLLVIQQRAAFYLFLISAGAILIIKKPNFVLIITIISIIIVLLGNINFDPENLGRLADIKDNGRDELYTNAWEFVQNNFLFGGRFIFLENSRLSSHNIVFNSFIYSGLMGACIIIYMMFLLFKDIFNSFTKFLNNKDITIDIIMSISLGIYLLLGFTHNNSLITGDLSIFLFYSIMLKSTTYPLNNEKI